MTSKGGVVSRLAAGQWGLLTTAQAEAEDVSRLSLSRLAAAGVLERLDQGVYAVAGAVDELTGIRAAWLALAPTLTAEERLNEPIATGVVSHVTAAQLHGLGDLTSDEAEFTIPTRRRTRRRGVRLHTAALKPDDVTLVEGLPTTTTERTIADLLAHSDQADLQHIADITGQALAAGTLSIAKLAAQLEPQAARWKQPSGQAAAIRLLDLAGYNAESTLATLESSPAGQRVLQLSIAKFLATVPNWPHLGAEQLFKDINELGASANTDAVKDLSAQFRKLLNSPAYRQLVATADRINAITSDSDPTVLALANTKATALANLSKAPNPQTQQDDE
jgi:hypothetical protein